MPAEKGNNGASQGSSAAENAKVTVIGRIGQLPQFRTVPDRQKPDQELLVGNFSIAEHPDPQTTQWHDVAVFGDRARQLQEHVDSGELQVGQEVEVVGSLHRRVRPTRDGGTKEVEQIYAYAVNPLRRDVVTNGEPPEPDTP